MAQFDILSVSFNLPQSGDGRSELIVTIDNPQQLSLIGAPQHDVIPENVEVVPPNGSQSQELWVHEDNYHLTITLGNSGGSNPLVVSNTNYFNQGDNLKYVDIIAAEKTPENEKEARKIRRRGVIVDR